MSIPFTQYVLPDGRQKPVTVERAKHIEDLAHWLIGCGCRFTVEILTTGQVSIACEGPDDEGDIALNICTNDMEVPATIDKTVEEAYRHILAYRDAATEDYETKEAVLDRLPSEGKEE